MPATTYIHTTIPALAREGKGSAEHRIIHRQTPWHHLSISSFPSAASQHHRRHALLQHDGKTAVVSAKLKSRLPIHPIHPMDFFSSLTSGHLANAAWILTSNVEREHKNTKQKYESRVSEEKVKRLKVRYEIRKLINRIVAWKLNFRISFAQTEPLCVAKRQRCSFEFEVLYSRGLCARWSSEKWSSISLRHKQISNSRSRTVSQAHYTKGLFRLCCSLYCSRWSAELSSLYYRFFYYKRSSDWTWHLTWNWS